MDEHRPDDAPDDAVEHGDGADASVADASAVGAEEAPIPEPTPDDPQPAWVAEPDDAFPDPLADAHAPDSWVGGAHGPGTDVEIGTDEPGAGVPDDPAAAALDPTRDRSGPADLERIELPVAADDTAAAHAGDDDLPGLAPPDDRAPWEPSGARIADPLADVRAFDEAGGDGPDVELVFEGDLDDDGDADFAITSDGTVLHFDDGFDVDELPEENGSWSTAGVLGALGTTVGIGAAATVAARHIARGRDAAIVAIEQLDDSGIDARVDHGDLVGLEHALANGDHVLISHIATPTAGAAWSERVLVVCAVDREHQQVLLAAPDDDAQRTSTTRTVVPTLRMALGSFVGSWADSAGEMIVVEATADAPRSLVLPIAVTDGLLRPVEDAR